MRWRINHGNLRLLRLHGDNIALGIERQAIGAFALLQKLRHRAIFGNTHNAVGTGFGKQHAAVLIGKRPFSTVKTVLDKSNRRTLGHHTRYSGRDSDLQHCLITLITGFCRREIMRNQYGGQQQRGQQYTGNFRGFDWGNFDDIA